MGADVGDAVIAAMTAAMAAGLGMSWAIVAGLGIAAS